MNLTAQAIRDGWYITGDIATLDDDGFLTITDRLSRFSKIGGNGAPSTRGGGPQLASGEELQVCAVTGVPDERKGEQLAVLHLAGRADSTDPGKSGRRRSPEPLSPLAQPLSQGRALPILGTGKLDLLALKRIAMERLGLHAS